MWEASSSPTRTAARVGRRPAAASRSTSSASSPRMAAATALPSSTLAAIGIPSPGARPSLLSPGYPPQAMAARSTGGPPRRSPPTHPRRAGRRPRGGSCPTSSVPGCGCCSAASTLGCGRRRSATTSPGPATGSGRPCTSAGSPRGCSPPTRRPSCSRSASASPTWSSGPPPGPPSWAPASSGPAGPAWPPRRPPPARRWWPCSGSAPTGPPSTAPEAAVGPQPDPIAGSRAWLLPNPSGLNAHYQLPDLAEAFAELRRNLE